jgi:hypothetical protein
MLNSYQDRTFIFISGLLFKIYSPALPEMNAAIALQQGYFHTKKQRETLMKITKDDIEVKMEIPGAIIRQKTDFGDATGLGKISGEYFSLSAGVDTSPLFMGLEGNLCQSPHWGYVLSGQLTTTDAEGIKETVNAKDLFYWPAGHNVKVNQDADIVMFSPQHEHTHVINHMIEMVKE